MTPIRLGVAGAGLAVRNLHWPAIVALGGRFRIVALSARSEASRRETGDLVGCERRYADFRQMIETERGNLDAVLVSMPIGELYEASAVAARAGLDVLCEKPLGGSLDEARRFVALPDQTGVSVQILENFRYRDDLLRAQWLVGQGRIGPPIIIQIRSIQSNTPSSGGYPGKQWRIASDAYQAGPLLDNGVHHLAAMEMVGGRITRAGGVVTRTHESYGGIDTALLTFEFESGAIGHYAFSNNSVPTDHDHSYFELRAYGMEGTLLTKDDGWTGIFSAHGTEWLAPEWDWRGYYNEFADFYRHKREGTPLRVTPDVAYRDIAALLTAVRGAQEGKMLDVEHLQG